MSETTVSIQVILINLWFVWNEKDVPMSLINLSCSADIIVPFPVVINSTTIDYKIV